MLPAHRRQLVLVSIGDQLGLYGATLSFEVQYSPSLSTGSSRDNNVILIARDDVTFVLPVSRVEPDVTTLLEVTVSHEAARHVNGSDVTRSEFILGLSDVRRVLLPASFYSLRHTSR